MGEPEFSEERVKAEAERSAAGGGDIREQVRNLTLRALRGKGLDVEGTKQVVRALTEGISLGTRRGGEAGQALKEAFAGLDEGLGKAAEASRLALQEMAARGQQLRDEDLKVALDQLKSLEGSFLDTVWETAQRVGGTAKEQWFELVTHARRAGTDTGGQVAATLEAFSRRMATVALDTQHASLEAAREWSRRFAEASSGFLAGVSDALHQASPPGPGDKKKG